MSGYQSSSFDWDRLMKTWTLKRLRNKPHIFYWKGEWRVGLREGYELQIHMARKHDALWFTDRLNARVYESKWFDMTKTDAGKFDASIRT